MQIWAGGSEEHNLSQRTFHSTTGKDSSATTREHTRSPELTSSDLSRYPPTLMAGLAAAIIQKHPKQGAPFAMGCQQAGERPPGGLTGPRQNPSPKTMTSGMMTPLLSNPDSRPDHCETEGANPRRGGRPPPLRPQSKLANTSETPLPTLAQSCAQEVQRSINRGDRKHPFPPGSFF